MEAITRTSLGRAGSWLQEWELPWQWRNICWLIPPDLLCGFQRLHAAKSSGLFAAFVLFCLSAILQLPHSLEMLLVQLPGHCASSLSLASGRFSWLLCASGQVLSEPLPPDLFHFHGITSIHVLLTPKLVPQALMLPMCSSLRVLTTPLTSWTSASCVKKAIRT